MTYDLIPKVKDRNAFTIFNRLLLDPMIFGKKNDKTKTIDLKKKQSFFDTLRKRRTHAGPNDILKCKICFKKITDVPEYCDKYITRKKRCNAGPFCSEKCKNEHLSNVDHY
jgi:hypothetical protein